MTATAPLVDGPGRSPVTGGAADARATPGIPLVVLIGAALAGLVLSLVGGPDAYLPLAWCVCVMLGALIAFEWRRVGHPLTPTGIVGLGGMVIFGLRPVAIASIGLTSPGALLDTRSFAGATVAAGQQALVQVLLFVLAFGVVYMNAMSRRAIDTVSGEPAPRATRAAVVRAGHVLVASSTLAIVCAALLVNSSGGLAAHLTGVSVRSEFLAGRYFLTLGYVPLAVALVVYVLARRHAGEQRTWDALALAGGLALLSSALLTGGRGPLVLGAILPLLILKQLGPKPLKSPALVAGGIALAVAAMVMSIFLRENVYSQGTALQELQDRPVETLVGRLTSGQEARPFDSLLLLNEADQAGRLTFQQGDTYLAVPTWFVPSSLLAGEKGGANTWFTKTYVPRFYYPDRIETSLSAIGEAYANFGWFGVPLIGGLLGWLAARFTARPRATVRGLATHAVLTPLFFSFVRGDAYHNVSLGLVTFLCVIVATWLVLPRSAGTARPR